MNRTKHSGPGIGQLDQRYVNVTGDTMTGALGIGTTPSYSLDVFGDATSEAINSRVGYNIDTVAAPPNTFTATAVSGSGLEIGTYNYRVAYYTAIGDTNASSTVAVTTTAGNQQVNLANIPTSLDPTVIGRKIYRGKVGEGSSYGFLIATIANNTATTYSDTFPDASITGSILTRSIYAKPNTTSKYISVDDTKAMVLDQFLTTVGYNAGVAVTNAPQCTFIGVGAGNRVTSGGNNTLIGYSAGGSITTGQDNIVIGSNGLLSATTGSQNISLGVFTLDALTTGSQNIGIGYNSLGATTDGQYNIGIGPNTLTSSGSKDYNIAIGPSAGFSLTTGDQNIFIGNNAGYRQTTNSNLLIIDNQIRADAATEASSSIIYGTMSATLANQRIRFNAKIDGSSASAVPVTVIGAASQTANLTEWQDSSGTVQLAVAGNGRDFILDTTTGTKIGTATTQKLGFWNATPIVQPTTNAYTSDGEGSAYTGIDNLQVGTVYAAVADLNQLRVAYETLRASYDDLLAKLKTTGIVS